MSKHGPATVRFPAHRLARESERVMASATPTVKVHVEVIQALLEADADRLQSETLQVALKVAEDTASEWLTCDVCSDSNETVDSDAKREFGAICGRCFSARDAADSHPNAWDAQFDLAHADKEEA